MNLRMCYLTTIISQCCFYRFSLYYVMTPLLQKELEDFQDAWNSHSIRKNHLTHLPEGVPNDLYEMPNPGS